MIENELQYEVTKKWAKHFSDAIARADELDKEQPTIDPRIKKAIVDSYHSQLDELNASIKEYEHRHVSDR